MKRETLCVGRGWFRWASLKNPSVIRNNKDPPAPSLPYPLPRQSFTLAGGHRSSQWPSYPSTPATCPGNDHRPGLALVFSIASVVPPDRENKHTPTPPVCRNCLCNSDVSPPASYFAPRDCSEPLAKRPRSSATLFLTIVRFCRSLQAFRFHSPSSLPAAVRSSLSAECSSFLSSQRDGRDASLFFLEIELSEL